MDIDSIHNRSSILSGILSSPSFENHKKIMAHLEATFHYLDGEPIANPQTLLVNHFKTERELADDILEITMTIEEAFPELSKYISEMPIKSLEADTEISSEALTGYYNSLDVLLTNYASYHASK